MYPIVSWNRHAAGEGDGGSLAPQAIGAASGWIEGVENRVCARHLEHALPSAQAHPEEVVLPPVPRVHTPGARLAELLEDPGGQRVAVDARRYPPAEPGAPG